MNPDPLEPNVEPQTTEVDPFSFSERPRDVSDSTGADFNHVSSDQNQGDVCFACFTETIFSDEKTYLYVGSAALGQQY